MPDWPIVDSHVHLADPGPLRLRLDEERAVAEPPRAARRPLWRPRRPSRSTGSSSSRSTSTMPQHLDEAAWVDELAAADPRLGGMVAALPLERGAAIAGDLEKLRRHKALRGVRRLIQNQPDPGILHQARFHRRAEAARAARPRLRHLRLPSSAAERHQDGAALPGGALRARPYRQAGDPRRRLRSLAAGSAGARGLAERLLQDIRRGDRGRSRELDARAAPALCRARDRLLRLRSGHVRRRLARAGTRLRPTRNGSRSSTGSSGIARAEERRRLFRDNAIAFYRLSA